MKKINSALSVLILVIVVGLLMEKVSEKNMKVEE
jgi:hypothetical protein